MTTLAEVADRAQNAIGDAAAGTWTQALVEEWIVEAIRDYSAHFARRVEDTISCTADTQEYNLPADFLGMLLVEYPAGEDPPEYLQFLPRHNPNFPSSDSYYDVLFTSDVGTVSIIRLSHDNVDGSDEIDITYLAQHDLSLVSGDTITVPSHH